MGYDTGELKAIWEIEAARTREEDRRDYERELAGIDIGREARFHGTEFVEERRQGRGGASSAQRSAQQQYASRLQMLLATNPGYAKAYNNTMDALGDSEKAADDAIEKLEVALTKARRETQDMLERAAKLPDGRRVFKDKNGKSGTNTARISATTKPLQSNGAAMSRHRRLSAIKTAMPKTFPAALTRCAASKSTSAASGRK